MLKTAKNKFISNEFGNSRITKKQVAKMDGPRDDIYRMDFSETMLMVRRLGLLPQVNQLIWNRLLQIGLGNPNPEIKVAIR